MVTQTTNEHTETTNEPTEKTNERTEKTRDFLQKFIWTEHFVQIYWEPVDALDSLIEAEADLLRFFSAFFSLASFALCASNLA